MSKPFRPKDHFFQKAKSEGYRARSAFKMEELARRFNVLRKGARVLDLGAAPGGFLQVIADAVGPTGKAVGVDIVPIRPFATPHVRTAVMDVLADDFLEQLGALDPGPFDAVISDMAPKTSGIRTTDEARSLRLAGRALDTAFRYGRPGGAFIAKLFMGGDFEEFRDALRARYADVKVVRPEATRGTSMEVYLVGLKLQPAPPSPPAGPAPKGTP
jgi:23S rRNA (uridine2552-2'-O)-methyltransferase